MKSVGSYIKIMHEVHLIICFGPLVFNILIQISDRHSYIIVSSIWKFFQNMDKSVSVAELYRWSYRFSDCSSRSVRTTTQMFLLLKDFLIMFRQDLLSIVAFLSTTGSNSKVTSLSVPLIPWINCQIWILWLLFFPCNIDAEHWANGWVMFRTIWKWV